MKANGRLRRQDQLLLPECLDDYVAADNPVRALDVFVDSLDLGSLGFEIKAPSTVGAPLTYERETLLKLLVYGYLNQIRSCRRLEVETKRNLEVIWLTEKAQPDHWTINEFRKTNLKAFRNVLRQFHRVCQRLSLFGKELEAIDGAFFKALNNKANNYTQAKLDRLEKKIDAAIDAYNTALDEETAETAETDGRKPPKNLRAVGTPEELQAKKQRIAELRAAAEASSTGQVSVNDPDSRLLKKGSQSVVGHNVQSVVDGKKHLLAHVEIVSAGNDRNQLEPMARSGCEALGIDLDKPRGRSAAGPSIVADGGYYHAAQIERCEAAGLRVHVPAGKTTAIDRPGYRNKDFRYDESNDQYVCPQGKRLERHSDTRQKEITYRVYYDTASCRDCPCREQCTGGKYRKLKISQYRETERRVARRLEREPEIYGRRMGLAEHPFGTLKSVWGYGQFMVTGKDKCDGELNLMALCYNWKRALAEVGTEALMEAIEAVLSAAGTALKLAISVMRVILAIATLDRTENATSTKLSAA